nr:DUF3558 domain-containing protein [Amycolatopsis sp. CA-230715]
MTAAAAGCSRGTPAAPQDSPAANSIPQTATTAVPFAGAPKVPSPLPDSAMAGDPCTVLTPQQVKDALGNKVSQKRDDISGIGPNCFWSTDSGATIAVTLDTEPRHGLSGLYANVQPKAEVWKVLSAIQGFPAVASVTPSGGKPDRYCNISVGLLDTATVDVGLFLGDSKIGKVDPCTVAVRAADAAVSTLRQKVGG